eukprot:gene20116-30667_t
MNILPCVAAVGLVTSVSPGGRIIAPAQYVYNWDKDHCKAFRADDGTVRMLGPVDLGSRAMVGRSLSSLTHS